MADDDIKNLPPEERLAKLKELEEKRKKELAETESLIKQSIEELTAKEERKMHVPIEQVAALNVESLQTDEEKEVFRAKRFVDSKRKDIVAEDQSSKPKQQTNIPWPKSPEEISLEQTLENENISKEAENAAKSNPQYNVPGREQQPQNLYRMINEASNEQSLEKIKELEGRPYREWNNDEREFARRMNYIADTNKESIREQYHGNISEEMLHKVDAVKEEMERLRGDYVR